jgi:hypothetical protein
MGMGTGSGMGTGTGIGMGTGTCLGITFAPALVILWWTGKARADAAKEARRVVESLKNNISFLQGGKMGTKSGKLIPGGNVMKVKMMAMIEIYTLERVKRSRAWSVERLNEGGHWKKVTFLCRIREKLH